MRVRKSSYAVSRFSSIAYVDASITEDTDTIMAAAAIAPITIILELEPMPLDRCLHGFQLNAFVHADVHTQIA